MRKSLAALAFLSLLGACATTDDTSDDTMAMDGGSTDAATSSPKLQLEHNTDVEGFFLVDRPTTTQGAVIGSVFVTRGGTRLSTATVKVNGVQIAPTGQEYKLTKNTAIPNVAPGGKLTVEATEGGETATLDVACSPEVTVTSPAANGSATSGGNLTVKWTGAVSPAGAPKSTLVALDYDTQANETHTSPTAKVVSLESTDTQKDVPLMPMSDLSADGYLLVMKVHGAATEGEGGKLRCGLVRQTPLKAQ